MKRILLNVTVVSLLVVLGCLGASADNNTTIGFPKTAFAYALMVEPELGVPPRVNLDKSVEIPLYIKGVQAYGNLGRSCDNPSFLGKDTVSGSTLQRYEGRTADGKPLPDVVWVAFGRNSSSSHKYVVGSVQMIGYNKKTGATAFFESSDRIGPWVTLDKGTLRMRGEMPWIDEPREFNRAFRTPGNTQCVQCHQNEPFITNSFINAAKIPGTKESVVPILNQDSPYYVIGGENWDMRTMHIKGNACFECHRVGMSTMTMFMKNGWDPNEHMPPHDPGSLAGDLQELLDAWRKGPDNTPGAEWIIPPARGKGRLVVGDDYQYKSAFNRPGARDEKAGWDDKDGKVEALKVRYVEAAREIEAAVKAGKMSKQDAEKKLSVMLQEMFGGEKNEKKLNQKAMNLKDRNGEVERLLKQLRDPKERKAFEDWIQENGVTEDTLEKLRSMAKGDDADDDKDAKDDYGKSEDKRES